MSLRPSTPPWKSWQTPASACFHDFDRSAQNQLSAGNAQGVDSPAHGDVSPGDPPRIPASTASLATYARAGEQLAGQPGHQACPTVGHRYRYAPGLPHRQECQGRKPGEPVTPVEDRHHSDSVDQTRHARLFKQTLAAKTLTTSRRTAALDWHTLLTRERLGKP